MDYTVKLKPPSMPNFIVVGMPVDLTGDFKTPSIPVGSLTKEQAQEYAQMMADEFMRHWNEKKSESEKTVARNPITLREDL